MGHGRQYRAAPMTEMVKGKMRSLELLVVADRNPTHGFRGDLGIARTAPICLPACTSAKKPSGPPRVLGPNPFPAAVGGETRFGSRSRSFESKDRLRAHLPAFQELGFFSPIDDVQDIKVETSSFFGKDLLRRINGSADSPRPAIPASHRRKARPEGAYMMNRGQVPTWLTLPPPRPDEPGTSSATTSVCPWPCWGTPRSSTRGTHTL